ncbi:hypothetical protein EYF80_029691 [Liparis tanakae]|uniref:Uncharacterized protein n=1 Tax=Liparis tanakae TaxID=230148 RepID=A0A4Z2H2Z6_9TELE|nr:hypothetical protein EYF80_029691 [Liparis tanakae]
MDRDQELKSPRHGPEIRSLLGGGGYSDEWETSVKLHREDSTFSRYRCRSMAASKSSPLKPEGRSLSPSPRLAAPELGVMFHVELWSGESRLVRGEIFEAPSQTPPPPASKLGSEGCGLTNGSQASGAGQWGEPASPPCLEAAGLEALTAAGSLSSRHRGQGIERVSHLQHASAGIWKMLPLVTFTAAVTSLAVRGGGGDFPEDPSSLHPPL